MTTTMERADAIWNEVQTGDVPSRRSVRELVDVINDLSSELAAATGTHRHTLAQVAIAIGSVESNQRIHPNIARDLLMPILSAFIVSTRRQHELSGEEGN